MLEMNLRAFITKVPELMSKLCLVRKTNLEFVGTKLAAKKGTKMIPVAEHNEEAELYEVKLNSLFDDDFAITANPNTVDILIQAKDGVMFIGEVRLCLALAREVQAGEIGFVAEHIEREKFRRGFWSVNAYDADFVKRITDKVKDFVKEAKTPDVNPEADPEAGTENPDDAPAGEEPKKPAKPKKGAKPEPKPEVAPEAAPEAEPEAEAPEAPVAEESDEGGISLRELFRAEMRGGESAEAECRRLCRKEGIEFDLEPEK